MVFNCLKFNGPVYVNVLPYLFHNMCSFRLHNGRDHLFWLLVVGLQQTSPRFRTHFFAEIPHRSQLAPGLCSWSVPPCTTVHLYFSQCV